MTLSISEARGRNGADVTVEGFIVVEQSGVWLCSELLESSPPQCGGEELQMARLPPPLEELLVGHGDVRWTDVPVSVQGTIDGDRLIPD